MSRRAVLHDGTTLEFPDGTPDAVIDRAVHSHLNEQKPGSFWHGVGDEIRHVAGNVDSFVSTLNPVDRLLHAVAPGTRLDPDATRAKIQAREQQLQNASPTRGTTAGKIFGGIGATLPALLVPGGSVAQSAAAGAMQTDSKNPLGIVRDAVIGGLFGHGGNWVGRNFAAPIAERIGRIAPVRALAQEMLKPPFRKPLPQLSNADNAIASAVVPSSVRQNLADAARHDLPYALADADPKLQKLAGSVTRFSPDAQALAERNFSARADDRGFRAIQGVTKHLAPPVDVKQVGADLMKTASAKSGPLYEQAYQGGSIAPLETQLSDAFNTTSKAVADARAELSAAQRQATLSKAAVHRAGDNVYMNADALPADRGAQAAIAAAEQKLASAQAQHGQVLEKLRMSQGDAAANAPGAVWNPRIQQFLDDPIAKQGLSRGLEIQRLEALANGKPFNPTEYGITGFDEAGKPIVSNVPNMRLLDAVKKGMDAQIADYPKDFKGNPILDERGRAITQVLKSYRGELDAVNPTYGDARGVYQGFAKQRDALNQGYDSTGKKVPARDLQNIVQGFNPDQLGRFRSGYATNLVDQVANATDSTDPYRLINGGINRRAKIETLFPEGAPQFNRLHELEDQMGATNRETLGGSQTQPRAVADEQFAGGGMMPHAINAGVQLATGGGLPGAASLALGMARKAANASLADRWRLGMFGAQGKADALAPTLLDTNPNAALAYLDELARKNAEMEARKQAYANAGGALLALPAATGAPILGSAFTAP